MISQSGGPALNCVTYYWCLGDPHLLCPDIYPHLVLFLFSSAIYPFPFFFSFFLCSSPTFAFSPSFQPLRMAVLLFYISLINLNLPLFHLQPSQKHRRNKRQTELDWQQARLNLQTDTNILCRKCLFRRWQAPMEWPHQAHKNTRTHTQTHTHTHTHAHTRRNERDQHVFCCIHFT